MKNIHRLKGNIKIKRFISFDVETYHEKINDKHTEQYFLLGGIITQDNEYLYFLDKNKMIEWFMEYYKDGKEKYSNTFIIATNLGFDFNKIFFDTKYYHKFEQLQVNGRLISARYKFSDNDHHSKLIMIDTMNYVPFSVETMGKLLNKPKLEKPPNFYKNEQGYLRSRIPKDANEWNMLIKYNKQDCQITKDYIEFYQKGWNERGAKLRYTTPSICMDGFTRKYLKTPIKQEYSGIYDFSDMLFSAYHGGHTEIFSRGIIEQPLYIMDINSTYAKAMTYEYPLPESAIYEKYPSIDKLDYLGVFNIDIEIPYMYYPILPIKSKPYKNSASEKLLFPYGIHNGVTHCNLEILKSLELGAKLKKINWGIYYKKTNCLFKEWARDNYSLRLKHKAENSPLEIIDKGANNYLYGKWAQRKQTEFKYIDLNYSENPEQDKELLINNTNNFDFATQTGYINKTINKLPDFSRPIFSIITTSRARIMLWELLEKYKSFYADTDCIFTRTEIEPSNKLGMLKLEDSPVKTIIIRPKIYFKITKDGDAILRAKGIKIYKQENKEQDLLNKEQIIQKIFMNEPITYEKFSQLKESIKNGIDVSTIIEVSKTININDDKRFWLQKFDINRLEHSEPLNTKHFERKLLK